MCKAKPIDFTEEDFNDKNLRNRFYKHISLQNESGCHLWTGARNNKNYGVFGYRYKLVLAHRFSYLLANGPNTIPEGLLLCHHCDNPMCVNVDHLFLGTNGDNMLDCYNKKRRQGICLNSPKGEDHYHCKLTEKQVSFIRSLKGTKITQRTLAYLYGISQGHVSDIRNNKKRKKKKARG